MAHHGRASANEFVPLDHANALLAAVDVDAEQIMQADLVVDDVDEDEPMNSPIFQYLSANNSLGNLDLYVSGRRQSASSIQIERDCGLRSLRCNSTQLHVIPPISQKLHYLWFGSLIVFLNRK
jgi:hypothetical protein